MGNANRIDEERPDGLLEGEPRTPLFDPLNRMEEVEREEKNAQYEFIGVGGWLKRLVFLALTFFCLLVVTEYMVCCVPYKPYLSDFFLMVREECASLYTDFYEHYPIPEEPRLRAEATAQMKEKYGEDFEAEFVYRSFKLQNEWSYITLNDLIARNYFFVVGLVPTRNRELNFNVWRSADAAGQWDDGNWHIYHSWLEEVYARLSEALGTQRVFIDIERKGYTSETEGLKLQGKRISFAEAVAQLGGGFKMKVEFAVYLHSPDREIERKTLRAREEARAKIWNLYSRDIDGGLLLSTAAIDAARREEAEAFGAAKGSGRYYSYFFHDFLMWAEKQGALFYLKEER